MARKPSPSTDTGPSGKHSPVQHQREGHNQGKGNGSALAQDWLNSPLAVPKQAVDALLEMQRQWLKTASMGSETLALELQELQQARDPVELVSAQFALANQKLEVLTRQLAAVMQQIYDAQLLWIGQWDHQAEAAPSAPNTASAAQQTQATLQAMGRVQDDWLRTTQSWIDSMNAGRHSG